MDYVMQKKNVFEQECLDLKRENEMLLLEIARLKEEEKTLKRQRDQYLREIIAIRESKTYQLARGITFLPRKLRSIKYVHSRAKGNKIIYPYMISVVIAVYNTKEFLVEMIETIINQKHDMLDQYLISNESSMFRPVVYDAVYELILVDDGSSDGSGDICDSYVKKYPFVKVIHKEHEGASSA
ncbi:MAG: glycosyltransferase, partial [Clostridia bacterium]|nr:glycosyltransferase [Clostridia bacterium]